MKPIDLSTNSRDLLSYLDKKREDRYFYRLIEITITVVVIAFFLIFAVRPSVLTISSLVGEINTKQKISSEMRKKINDVVLAQEVYAQIQEKYQLIDSALPSSPQYGQLTQQIVAAGDYSQSPVNSLNFNLSAKRDTTDDSGPKSINFSFGQETTFSNFKSFVEKISQNRRLFRIISLGLGSPAEAKTSSSLISVSSSFDSFYLDLKPTPYEKK
ncbi:MAG: hypothetical protein WCV93_04940 [Candidatus Shapirobacteria bacterium]|jgi:hypothetical protein